MIRLSRAVHLTAIVLITISASPYSRQVRGDEARAKAALQQHQDTLEQSGPFEFNFTISSAGKGWFEPLDAFYSLDAQQWSVEHGENRITTHRGKCWLDQGLQQQRVELTTLDPETDINEVLAVQGEDQLVFAINSDGTSRGLRTSRYDSEQPSIVRAASCSDSFGLEVFCFRRAFDLHDQYRQGQNLRVIKEDDRELMIAGDVPLMRKGREPFTLVTSFDKTAGFAVRLLAVLNPVTNYTTTVVMNDDFRQIGNTYVPMRTIRLDYMDDYDEKTDAIVLKCLAANIRQIDESSVKSTAEVKPEFYFALPEEPFNILDPRSGEVLGNGLSLHDLEVAELMETSERTASQRVDIIFGVAAMALVFAGGAWFMRAR